MPSTDRSRRHAARRTLTLMLLGLGLGGCISMPPDKKPVEASVNVEDIPDAVPKVEPYSKYGNPPYYTVMGKRYKVLPTERGYVEQGIASWYGPDFHGKKTSSGEPYDMHAMTAAHTSLPIPCYVRVTNLENGKSVVVRVNDRGPFKKKRVIDLSKTAAIKLGITGKGTGLVEVRAISPGESHAPGEPAPSFRPVHGNIYVQVGAYGDPSNAERMRARLAASLPGEQIRIQQFDRNGSLLHRVQVGPFRDVDKVDSVESRIIRMGIDTYILID